MLAALIVRVVVSKSGKFFLIKTAVGAFSIRCHDIQHNDNDTQYNDTQHNDTQHIHTQHRVSLC